MGRLVVLPIAAEKMPYIAKTDIKIHIEPATYMLSKKLMETPRIIKLIVNPSPCLVWNEAKEFLFSLFIDIAISGPKIKI